MWKLLSGRDRHQIKLDEQTDSPQGLHQSPHVITTSGVGHYSCQNCQHYRQPGPDHEKSCADHGVPPDAMPCGWSPKKPEMHFLPIMGAASPMSALETLDLQGTLVLATMLPKRVETLVRQEALKLPYRVGDHVGFVYRQTLVSAKIVDLDQESVHVDHEGEPLALPHETVIPKSPIVPA